MRDASLLPTMTVEEYFRFEALDIVAREPCIVVEVTSPSTARIDRGEKLEAYRRIPALRAYLIVDHRRRRVERHWRESPGGV